MKINRRMEQMKVILPTVMLLVVFLAVVKLVLETDSTDSTHSTHSPHSEYRFSMKTHGNSRLQMSDDDLTDKVSIRSSNFCSSFAINELIPDGNPRIAIFHHTTTANEFTADTPTHTTLSGTVGEGEYEYFQVCVAEHKHHHKISLDLKRDLIPTGAVDSYEEDMREVDLYISADYKRPKMDFGATWISRDKGDDSITIPTYVKDFEVSKSHTLYVGVHNRGGAKAGGEVGFTLEVRVVDVKEREVLRRGSLRGGKRIMSGQAPDLEDVRRAREGRKKEDGYAV